MLRHQEQVMHMKFGIARQTFIVRSDDSGKLDVLQTAESLQECESIDCVYLTGAPKQAQRMQKFLAAADAHVQIARSVQEASMFLSALDSRVLIVDCLFPGGTWEDSLELVVGSVPRIELVVVAPTILADLWEHALPAGAFEVVLTPLAGEDICCVVRSADRYARRLVSSSER